MLDIDDYIYPTELDDVAVILYTSGTTGKPKGSLMTHRSLSCNALDLVKVWEITEYDTILHMLPLFHVHGLFFSIHTALLAGASIFLLPKFDVNLFFKYLPHSTVFMGVPTYYVRLINDERLNQENCQHIRLFVSGSAPLLPFTFTEFQSRAGHTLLERYGMTETGINTSNPLDGLKKMGTVGLPLPNVKVRVVDENNKILTPNQTGHVQIKGNNLFKGYWKRLDKKNKDFTNDGYFKTGDLGVIDKDGYLSLVGRFKDIIITGGLNVYPKEIELSIDSMEGVAESAVIGVPHPDFGEAVIAVIVPYVGISLSEEVVIDCLKSDYAAYKIPKKVFFISELPKNTMGKVQKDILRNMYSNLKLKAEGIVGNI